MMGTWGAIVGSVCAFLIIAIVRIVWVGHYINVKLYWGQLIIDIMIALGQGILVTLDWNVAAVSAVAIIIFIINHLDIIKAIRKRFLRN